MWLIGTPPGPTHRSTATCIATGYGHQPVRPHMNGRHAPGSTLNLQYTFPPVRPRIGKYRVGRAPGACLPPRTIDTSVRPPMNGRHAPGSTLNLQYTFPPVRPRIGKYRVAIAPGTCLPPLREPARFRIRRNCDTPAQGKNRVAIAPGTCLPYLWLPPPIQIFARRVSLLSHRRQAPRHALLATYQASPLSRTTNAA